MIVTKTESPNDFSHTTPQQWVSEVDTDLKNLFLCLQGRVRFGNSTNNLSGENIMGEFVVYTTNATPNTEDKISHTLGSIPVGYLVISKDKACDVYQKSNTGTAWTTTNIYLKATVASASVTLFLLQ
jgi:hypothetical protein